MLRSQFLVFVIAASTGCAGLSTLQKESEKPKDQRIQDDGIMGELHGAHADKIVFSQSAVPADAPAATELRDAATLGDVIFARAFFSESAANHFTDLNMECGYPRWQLRVGVDGGEKQALDWAEFDTEQWTKWTAIRFGAGDQPLWGSRKVFWPSMKSSITAANTEMELFKVIDGLADGEHSLAFEFQVRCRGEMEPQVLATGDLALTVDAAGRAAFASNVGPYLIRNAMQDKGEVTRLHEVAKGVFPKTKILDFRVLETAWKVSRSTTGEPISRAVLVASVLEKEAGKCVVIGDIVHEEAMGGGKFGAPEFRSAASDGLGEFPFPCQNAQITVE